MISYSENRKEDLHEKLHLTTWTINNFFEWKASNESSLYYYFFVKLNICYHLTLIAYTTLSMKSSNTWWKFLFKRTIYAFIFKLHTCRSSLFFLILDGYSDIEARLVVRKYVEKGASVTLYCEHNVDPKILYKVSITCEISV